MTVRDWRLALGDLDEQLAYAQGYEDGFSDGYGAAEARYRDAVDELLTKLEAEGR